MSTYLATVHKSHVKRMCQPSHTWLKKSERPLAFLQGAGSANLWLTFPFVAFASAPFVSVLSFDRRRALVRLHFPTTGSRPSDSPRAPINVDRAARDIAYFFYHLPVDRISWAFPYVPPGLFTQLVISRSRELQATTLDPAEWSIAARFSYLQRPPMGRGNLQPQATGAAASSTAAAPATAPAGDPQDQEAPASPEEVVGTAPSAETTDQEIEEASETDPLPSPRVATAISPSQPTFTPPGSATAGAEEFEESQDLVAEPTTDELPIESSTLGAAFNAKPLSFKQGSRPEPLLRAERSRMSRTIR